MLRLLFLVVVLFCSERLIAQLQYTSHFTKELAKCQGMFIAPVEGLYKIKFPKKDQRSRYDLILESEEKALEIRYILEPDYQIEVPHITCLTTASSYAINEDHFDIHVNIYDPEQAQSLYNAEWAAYADFIPKPSVSNRFYGRLVTLFRDNDLMQIVLFFNRHDDEKDVRMYSLAFQPPIKSLN